ncbi:putative permease [Azorhizobium caulinodans ORS 571]|uniref:Putative permease n=1 Tax=Azorhizobium caulinodans (strain ATCC 43989 / DSM 5975 / JCM 20966 / LMG 6465 / NBRC 14845 / NCIMB 13405 / ORS 571) TaxID=438753 RepID=A8ICW6_AZOC5|nr:AEC family transporter [Azorhizobium caulinodans]BAF88851.1 putative permease [Azorhizobium caulinodans ORS 571]
MLSIISALIPTFLVIVLGVVLRRVLLKKPDHWVALEQLTYFVLFPALLIVSAVKADLSGVSVLAVVGAMFGAILIMSAVLLVLRRPIVDATGIDGPAFTSLFQGVTRWNTYVALAVCGGLYGAAGVTVAAVALVAMIPAVNVICVIVLARYVGAHAPTPRFILGQLLRNPFIWSCLAGALLNGFAVPVPKVVVEFGDILGRASLALGLLVVGGGLALDRLNRLKPVVILAVVLKLFAKPAVAILLGLAVGLSGTELAVLAIVCAVPSAPNGYVLARQMGGDAPLLAEMLTFQIIVAAASLPLVLSALKMVVP